MKNSIPARYEIIAAIALVIGLHRLYTGHVSDFLPWMLLSRSISDRGVLDKLRGEYRPFLHI